MTKLFDFFPDPASLESGSQARLIAADWLADADRSEEESLLRGDGIVEIHNDSVRACPNRERLKALLAGAAIEARRAEDEVQDVDAEHPYDPFFFLQLNWGAAGFEVEDEPDRVNLGRGDFDLEVAEEQAEAILTAHCWRWFGNDGHSGDCAERGMYQLGSPELQSALAVEVESWRMASIENNSDEVQ